MGVTYRVLQSDADFLAAALAQSHVSVWFLANYEPNGRIMDEGGIVEFYSPLAVKISGINYVRRKFEFRMVLA